MILVALDRSWQDWRYKARELLAQKIPPHLIDWRCDQNGFMLGELFEDKKTEADIRFSKEFISLAWTVSCYRDDTTWALLYRVAWRLLYENKNLLRIPLDPDVRELEARRHCVSRDVHKMHAFVRFREVVEDEKTVFMAWHRPDHRILRLAVPFFKDRFNGMNWVIMTEDETAAWDQKEVTFLPGVAKHELPPDEKEELWKTYYSSIFNPARVKVAMMKKEMAVRYWGTMPEAELITSLLDSAPQRVEEFYQSQLPVAKVAPMTNLADIYAAMRNCRACGICEKATAPVAGLGPQTALLAFVGEQPGSEEDTQGLPFVGPAGQVLMDAFEHVGLRREEVFLTNAVKGFKWVASAMDRQHRTAGAREISACRPWVQAEMKIIRPEILVCLGRTAAQSVLGKLVKIEEMRGKFFETPSSPRTIILPHPASILRTPDPDLRIEAQRRFLEDMRLVARAYRELRERTSTAVAAPLSGPPGMYPGGTVATDA